VLITQQDPFSYKWVEGEYFERYYFEGYPVYVKSGVRGFKGHVLYKLPNGPWEIATDDFSTQTRMRATTISETPVGVTYIEFFNVEWEPRKVDVQFIEFPSIQVDTYYTLPLNGKYIYWKQFHGYPAYKTKPWIGIAAYLFRIPDGRFAGHWAIGTREPNSTMFDRRSASKAETPVGLTFLGFSYPDKKWLPTDDKGHKTTVCYATD